MPLQKFNLSTSQTSAMWARIIVRRLSFDWSRKLAINTSRSLVSIFSNSLGSFLQTKYFINNETSLCVLLNVFLVFCFFLFVCFFFDATQTLLRSNQPTKTCYSFPSSTAFCVKKFGSVARKPPNLESHKRWTTLIFESVDEILKCGHLNESYCAVLSHSTVYYALQGSSKVWVCGWNHKVWPFPVVQCIMLYKVVLIFESVVEILWCDHSNESYWVVLSCDTVYYAVQGSSNFWVFGWNH